MDDTRPGRVCHAVTEKETGVGRLVVGNVLPCDPQTVLRVVHERVDAGKTSRERLLLGLSSGFAALAILLAAVGLYGTLAYMVSRRTREIGVRLAFGATRDTILRMVVGDAVRLAAVALAIGIPLSLAVGYSLRRFLFGVEPTDPATLAGACLVLTTAALLAAYVPARRAAAVDPIVALRCE